MALNATFQAMTTNHMSKIRIFLRVIFGKTKNGGPRAVGDEIET